MIELLTGVQSSKKNYYTELKETVAQLTKKNKQLELINELMKGFAINFSVEHMLQQIFYSLQEIHPVEIAGIRLTVDTHILSDCVFPANDALIPHDQLFDEVFATGRDAIYAARITGQTAAYLAPLKSSRETIGVFYVASAEEFNPSIEDLEFFSQLAGQIAVCLENSRLYSEVLARKQQWEETFRAVSDAVLIVSAEGFVQLQNDAAKNDWQLQIGSNIEAFIEGAANHANPFRETLKTGLPQSAELHFRDQLYDCSCYPLLGANGHCKAVVMYSRNITAKREMEVQLMHSNQLVAIGEMAAGVAHELNNPLTSIIGNTQLLLRTVEENDIRQPLLADIDTCGKRCRTTIRSLLAFSRQENSPYTACCLNDAVEQALVLTKRQFESQRITITTELASLPQISGNVQQLSQIIVNLLINAKDALADCETDDRQITITTAAADDTVELALSDNGAPFAAQAVDDIFRPFFTTKDSENGTGLGLSVSLGLAQAHGGALTAAQQNEPRLKTFRLTLPIPSERQ